VALPRRDLLAPARDLLGTTMWLAALVLALGALGAWALSRQITGPLAEMTRAATGIAGGDYAQRVTISRRADELGQLAASFNTMASQVDATTQELEHQMEQLQDQAGELEHQTEAAQALAQQLEASNEEISRALVEAERARDEARAAEDRYQLLVNSLMVGVVLIDGAAGIVAANPAAERILGLTLDQMSGRSSVDREWGIVRDDGSPQPPEQNPVVMSLRTGEPVSNNVAGVRRPDDTRVWIEVNAQPLFRPKESAPYAAVVSFADVTARKQLEAQLRQSQKMEAVGQLAGGVAHDFNNLLTVIKGHTEFALEDVGTSRPQAATDLTTVREAADRAAALTRQLLAFSRQQILQPQVLDLNGLVSNFEKMVRRVIPADIAIVANLAGDLALVEADPGQLEQVLMNLVVNARDAMPDGGTITIETANVELDPAFPAPHAPTEIRPGPYVALVVSDTGSGMDEVIKARIFEPFFTTKERGSGTGLGLATVYGIVKQSGGYVWVYSELGEGTTFRIYLPRTASESVEVHRAAEQPAVPRGAETILVVEDEPLVRGLASRVLAKNGYRVLTAANGAEALRASAESTNPIDLVVSDLVMPEMGGRELAEQLRTRHSGVRVLFMSGYTEDAALRRAVLRPGEAFLAKPFTPDALARKVREVLDTAPGAAVPSLPMPGSSDPARR
jgi:two-component system cell cycle sensor histidine kinase/response regulator CckA